MSLQVIKGDLFDPEHDFDALAHGVNCQGVMGAGIAVHFRNKYPDMYPLYRRLCIQYADSLPGLMQFYHDPGHFLKEDENTGNAIWEYPPHVYNLFTQIDPGRNAEYRLVRTSALLMRLHAENNGYHKVGLPWIGCGIGGLEKHNVEHILSKILEESVVQFTIVEQ